MASQFGMRAAQQTFRQSAFNFRNIAQRRLQSTAPASPAAGTNAQVVRDAAVEQKGFAKLWNSPVGPKTVHFWAPIMKWGLVLAGAADFARPAKDISLSQNVALMATGLIWTRWCFVIRPQNMFLASVNFLLFCVGTTQVTRVLRYQSSLGGAEGVKAAIKDEEKNLEKVVKDAEAKVEAKLSK